MLSATKKILFTAILLGVGFYSFNFSNHSVKAMVPHSNQNVQKVSNTDIKNNLSFIDKKHKREKRKSFVLGMIAGKGIDLAVKASIIGGLCIRDHLYNHILYGDDNYYNYDNYNNSILPVVEASLLDNFVKSHTPTTFTVVQKRCVICLDNLHREIYDQLTETQKACIPLTEAQLDDYNSTENGDFELTDQQLAQLDINISDTDRRRILSEIYKCPQCTFVSHAECAKDYYQASHTRGIFKCPGCRRDLLLAQ